MNTNPITPETLAGSIMPLLSEITDLHVPAVRQAVAGLMAFKRGTQT